MIMNKIFYLTRRNCLIYLRDKSAVFFSIMSTLIALGVMVVFLGKMNSENVLYIISNYSNAIITEKERINASCLVQMWTLSGMISVNAVTVAFTVIGTMIHDETAKKIANWLGFELKDQTKKKQCFDPSRSINNTYTWKKVKCNPAEIEYIENELGEYLYGFPPSN